MNMTHRASVFISTGQKTAKTECGKRVPVSTVAIDEDCTCRECRAAIDASWNSVQEALNYARSIGAKQTYTQKQIDADKSKRYRSIRFL